MNKFEIRSPLPGTFYRASSPDAAPFKADGDDVAESDVIGVIEVMKTFHEIPAGAAGRNILFAAENEEPIMAGQVIAEIEQ
ncbi:biotin carboxyl carrier domain-containing protein [Sinorhizobium meliloti]|jgi:acetyl-CoA carboxylase biotin carboxyl carrier protein|uniref:acetyl-CoA carboxylase n=1 Tax=Rhizobium meliloti TaxID=382 RepID=UPI000419891B|nr:acetyl-CoA carboxylase [Sinorhizobium meliloti]MDW9356457.1 biotin carboxyl carrier domain-containing protein [Sinorhizobium meliloti]MDW9592410.1 biotin carboxyl carrier domain-containing protein [Sinorhizobium meliloti]MDW9655385.1 biotin carboxyl carrier domain-containing protein [Sinorhizobium meliloti]MDW9915185.1 biotin carboxyl carrier domain-containing protein [Sinorhizobium meliloti]MDW9939792.1 biotin carboxyl carrier domain-containing protein [Sinorhizobium meliloti]